MLKENLENVEQKIQAACERSGRDRSEVTLIAVSKTKPAEMVQEAYDLGIRLFGENKVQEIMDKSEVLPADIHWHMIGHLQRNKIKYIIDKVDLIHSVDSLRLAEAIEKEAAKKHLIAKVLIEVNVGREESKFGFLPEELDDFVDAPKPNGEEREYITRVALDPIRKLSRNDRLTGIAMICMENNIECPNLIKAIAYGMSYDCKEDISAKKIQNLILEKGIKKAISNVIGVDEMHPIIKKIQNEYLKIR